ncbi:hypothetical protein TNCV_203551 [Trichonephila clavipes]|nr:hypothetical protein TNCV_203551 [Trichonephila clavipes]
METFRRCKQAYVDALMMMPDHYPEEPFYVRALTELQDIEETMALVVSDINSFEPWGHGLGQISPTPKQLPEQLTLKILHRWRHADLGLRHKLRPKNQTPAPN